MRNCHNRRGIRHPILQGAKEWRQVSSTLKHVLKIGDLKFFSCPVSTVTRRTWDLMRLVNETVSSEHCDILHLIAPGTILDQPPWFLQSVRTVRSERTEHRRRELEK